MGENAYKFDSIDTALIRNYIKKGIIDTGYFDMLDSYLKKAAMLGIKSVVNCEGKFGEWEDEGFPPMLEQLKSIGTDGVVQLKIPDEALRVEADAVLWINEIAKISGRVRVVGGRNAVVFRGGMTFKDETAVEVRLENAEGIKRFIRSVDTQGGYAVINADAYAIDDDFAVLAVTRLIQGKLKLDGGSESLYRSYIAALNKINKAWHVNNSDIQRLGVQSKAGPEFSKEHVDEGTMLKELADKIMQMLDGVKAYAHKTSAKESLTLYEDGAEKGVSADTRQMMRSCMTCINSLDGYNNLAEAFGCNEADEIDMLMDEYYFMNKIDVQYLGEIYMYIPVTTFGYTLTEKIQAENETVLKSAALKDTEPYALRLNVYFGRRDNERVFVVGAAENEVIDMSPVTGSTAYKKDTVTRMLGLSSIMRESRMLRLGYFLNTIKAGAISIEGR